MTDNCSNNYINIALKAQNLSHKVVLSNSLFQAGNYIIKSKGFVKHNFAKTFDKNVTLRTNAKLQAER